MKEFTIKEFMTKTLGLEKTELMVFAIIHSYSKAEGGCFFGSNAWIKDFIKCSERSVRASINSLLDKGYISCIGLHPTLMTNQYVSLVHEADDVTSLGEGVQKLPPGAKIAGGRGKNCRGEGQKLPPPIYNNTLSNTLSNTHSNTDADASVCGDVNVKEHDAAYYREAAERLYQLYPYKGLPSARYPKGRSTGKSTADKLAIERKLKNGEFTEEEFAAKIHRYLEEETQGYYMNLSTFISRPPDYEDEAIDISPGEAAKPGTKYTNWQ